VGIPTAYRAMSRYTLMKYTQDQLEQGKRAVREYVDRTGYGSYISDQVCGEITESVLEAIDG